MILSTSAILLIRSFPESLPHYLYSLLKSRHFSLSNPPLISYFLHGNACHNLFLLHNVHPPHITRATTNPPLPSAFMPLWSPGVPLTFSPLLCISAPHCGSPPTLHGRGFAVTYGSQPLLMPERHTSTEQRANLLVSPHCSIFLPFHDFSSKLRGFCPPTCCNSLVSQLGFELCTGTPPQHRFLPNWAYQALQALPVTAPPTAASLTCICLQRPGRIPRVGHRAFWRATSLLDVPASPTAASNSHWRALFFQLATLKSVLPVFAVNRCTKSKPYRPSIWI